jgi:hypothetical protein
MKHKTRYARRNCSHEKSFDPKTSVMTLQHREEHDDARDDADQAD